MTDIFRTVDDWALGGDDLQWTLYRRHKKGSRKWKVVAFVRSTRSVLEKTAKENGLDGGTAKILFSGLPGDFNAWKMNQTPF